MTGPLRVLTGGDRQADAAPDPAVTGYELAPREQTHYGRAVDEHFLADMTRRGIAPNTPEFCDAAELAEGALPDPARRALAQLRRGDTDALLLRGLPRDAATASGPHEPDGVHLPCRGHAWIAMALRRLGHEIAYTREKQGTIVHDIVPTHEGARAQSNESWQVDLGLHTDNAFHPLRPDFVLLYCVRAAPDPPATKLSLLDDILTHLTDAEIAVLRERRFAVRVVESFRSEGELDGEVPVRVLGGSPRRPTVRWHGSLRGTDPQSAGARDAFHDAAVKAARHVPLRAGDLLALANHRCLHGRDRFHADLDGRDRWLLRAYAVRDWTRTEHAVAPATRPAVRLDLSAEIGI